MITPYKNGYALGVGVRDVNWHRVIHHDGGIPGFVINLVYYPDDNNYKFKKQLDSRSNRRMTAKKTQLD